MFFNAKKEETGAIQAFKKTCTYHGLTINLSLMSLTALKHAVENKLSKKTTELSEREAFVLGRRGLIKATEDGNYVITELGLLVITLAEAGGLVSIKKG